MQHPKQTNKINGSNLIDIVEGNHPALPLIPVDIHPGSPNHHLEAGVVKFGYYGLIAPNGAEFLLATQFLIQFLQDQLLKGHMGIEVLTDSHEAIYLRAMLGLRLFQIRVLKSDHLPSPNVEIWKLVATLIALTLQWFNLHASVLSLGYIPFGPLAGCILLPCARKRGAARGENRGVLSGVGAVSRQGGQGGRGRGAGGQVGKGSGRAPGGIVDPSDLTRDVWYGEVAAPGPTRSTGVDFWTLSKDRQDTASGPLYRLVEKEGGEWMIDIRKSSLVLPKLISPLEVTRYINGHIARFSSHLTLEDGVTYCKVEWSTGRFTFIEEDKEEGKSNDNGMDLGKEVSKSTTRK